MEQLDIAIIGGGLVGLTLATALGGSDLQVAVIDPADGGEAAAAERPDYDPRVSALTAASEQILRNLGAWDTMAGLRVCPYREMEVWDGQGTGRIHFSAADVHTWRLGHIVENRVTQAGLLAALGRHANLVRFNGAGLRRLCPRENGRRSLLLEDGRELAARLVVAADGARSVTRRQAGLAIQEQDYQHHAIVATVRTERPHQSTAWQRFTEDGPLAFLPLAGGGGHLASIVWSTSPDHARALMALETEAFNRALAGAFEYRLGAVDWSDTRHCLPLTQRHAPAYVAEGLALVGDAAHSIHPLAGQGVNLGLLDAATLAEELLEARGQGDDFAGQGCLRRYQRRRQAENLAVIALMAGFRHLYGDVPPPLQWLRNWGMSTLDRLAPIKRQLVTQALGQRHDLPVLARPPRPERAAG